MSPELQQKIESQIDAALTANPESKCDDAYAAAGHVDLTNWRMMFLRRREALKAQASKTAPAKETK